MKRTHTCGELRIQDKNKSVVMQGWISKVRKLGGMTFIDIRDMYGITQLIFSQLDQEFKNEYVIEVSGKVVERKSKNPEMATGEIEVDVSECKIISKSILTPFEIKDNIDSQEDTRLSYRYLDLRRPEIQKNLIFRSKLNQEIRNFFIKNNFIEIETPIFGKSTPEGARDFLVPSRLNKNKFYALPQSPQLYKQLFMVAGIDRYFQIARCFRDEDLRIDRQPEFTQLDMEMSFSNKEDVMNTIEKLIIEIIFNLKNYKISSPILRMSYDDAFDGYGSDKPDLRFDLKIQTLNKIFEKTEFDLFKISSEISIRSICVDSVLSNKEIEVLTESAKQNNAKNLFYLKFSNKTWSGSVSTKISESEKKKLLSFFNKDENSEFTILITSDSYEIATKAMGAVRLEVAKIKKLFNNNEFSLLWVTDFPLFEFSEEENRYVACHHPFTMPDEKWVNNFDKDLKNCKAAAYDIVLNGYEIGGGSQRITDPLIQKRMFDAIGLSEEQIKENFGWFVSAYNYGAPFHAGCALGIDRIAMILTNSKNIREVIAFPKNSSGIDPMTNAPDNVSINQLNELNIKLK